MRWFGPCVLAFLTWPLPGAAQSLLVPMDRAQENHLKAYGLTYWALEQYGEAEWLLNYRGGSFLLPNMEGLRRQAALRGITTEVVSGADIAGIRAVIADSNMETVILEKAPKVAIYTPPNSTPWDDAVTMALEYAQIPYQTIWDDDVIRGRLGEYEWLICTTRTSRGSTRSFSSLIPGPPGFRKRCLGTKKWRSGWGSRTCRTSRRASPGSYANTWKTADSVGHVFGHRDARARTRCRARRHRGRVCGRVAARSRTLQAEWNGISRWPLWMAWCRPVRP